MSEQEKQESQKTVVAFIAGLLIGGLLVWVFGGTPDDNNKEEVVVDTSSSEVVKESPTVQKEVTNKKDEKVITVTKAELPTGNGSVKVENQQAGTSVSLSGATFPSDEGWIGVREYTNGQLAGLLGVVRYSKVQGLVPETIVLQRATTPGNNYAVVFYSENGDRVFNLAEDVQVGGVMETFTVK